jgi:hypothetical protein
VENFQSLKIENGKINWKMSSHPKLDMATVIVIA